MTTSQGISKNPENRVVPGYPFGFPFDGPKPSPWYMQILGMDWAPAFAPNGVSIDRGDGVMGFLEVTLSLTLILVGRLADKWLKKPVNAGDATP